MRKLQERIFSCFLKIQIHIIFVFLCCGKEWFWLLNGKLIVGLDSVFDMFLANSAVVVMTEVVVDIN